MSEENKETEDVFVLPNDYFLLFYENFANKREIELLDEMVNAIIMFFYALFLKIKGVFIKVSEKETNEPVKEVVKSSFDIFAEKEKDKFFAFLQNNDINKINENIEDVFYNAEDYRTIMKEENNEIEKKWKGKILMEHTPYGNIVMTYDAYKKGFSYYCDQQGVSYKVLNACAMKYVRTFCCFDFYLDERDILEGKISRFIELDKEEEKKEKEKKKKDGKYGLDPEVKKNAPFAKLKNYRLDDKKSGGSGGSNATEKDVKTDNKPEKIVSLNRFMYLGRVHNFCIIQNVPKKLVMNFSNHSYSNIFKEEMNLQKEVLNYKDFKKALQKQEE